MQAGKLRHFIDIQMPVSERDLESGEFQETAWQSLRRCWASIEPLSVRDFVAANAVQSEVTARIVMRYSAGITTAMRVVYQGKIYDIKGVLPDAKSGREYLTLAVAEGVNDG